MTTGPASPSLRMSRAIALSSGAPLHAATEARRCAHPECPTRLSRYNPDTTCARHGGWVAEAPPKRRRPKAADSSADSSVDEEIVLG